MLLSDESSSKKSTPVKEKLSSKHPLTPSAKESEPSSKRLASCSRKSPSHLLPSTSTYEVVGEHPSGLEIKKRRCSLTTAINEHYEVVVGDENVVTQEEILQTLEVSSAKVLTQTISKHFPDVKVSQRILSGGREIVYEK